MPLGGQNYAIAGPNGSADVFRLTGFLGDNDLIGHDELVRNSGFKNYRT